MAYYGDRSTFSDGNILPASDLNGEFSKVSRDLNDADLRLLALEAGSGFLSAADAINNIPNLLVNGDFWGVSGAETPYESLPSYVNANYSTELVQHAPGWYMKNVGGNLDIGGGVDGQLDLLDNGSSGDVEGYLFQRLDYHIPITQLRGRAITLAVRYSCTAAGAFQLDIDDGVDQTLSTLTDTIAGTANVIQVTHTINAAATKLRIGLYVPSGSSIAPSVSATVTKMYAKLGTGTITLNAGVHPMQPSIDELRLQRMHQHFFYGTPTRKFIVPGVVRESGTPSKVYGLFIPNDRGLVVSMDGSSQDVLQQYSVTDSGDSTTMHTGVLINWETVLQYTRSITGSVQWRYLLPRLDLYRNDSEAGFSAETILLSTDIVPNI